MIKKTHLPMQETWVWSLGQETPCRRAWLPTPVFLPGESHGQRNLVGYSPYGHKESDTAENNNNKKNLDNKKEYRISSICFSYFCVKIMTHNLICGQLFHIFYYNNIFVWYGFVLSCLSKIWSPYLTFTLRSIGFLTETWELEAMAEEPARKQV